jgi:hypothetical protein
MMELHPEAFFFFYTPYFSWLKLPGLSDAVKTVQVFLFGIAPPFGSWGSMTPASLNSLFILMILALAGGLFAMSGPWMKRGRIFFVGLLGPLALGFGYSYLITPVYYADRYSLIAYPAFIITLCGIFAARTRWVRYVSRFAGVLYCLVCATQLACYFTNFEKAPWKDIAGVIESLPEPRAVDTSGLSLIDRQTLRYYMPSTPEWEGAHFWWKNFTDSPLGTQTHLAIPIKTWYTGNIKDTLPPAWRVDRIVYINDAVIYILKKLPAIPAAGALTNRG